MVLRTLLFIFLLLGLVAAGAGAGWVFHAVTGETLLQADKNILIPRHSNAAAIGTVLQSEGVVATAWVFRLRHLLDGRPELKAGEYHVTAHMKLAALLQKMVKGEVVIRKITIPEGWTSSAVSAALQKEPALSGTLAATPAEGSLLPNTYQFTYGDDRNRLVATMQSAMQEALAQAWQQRDADLPLTTPEQLLNLAAIVEKETAKPEERARIAGVYLNRLKKGMLLQCDPTVIYGLTNGRGVLGHPLTAAELAQATPYNSYRVAGLPPTPIANPGKAALWAAAHPEKHDYLYFVADGSGGHHFAATLEEHNKNVAAWRRLEKK